jgi:hypothetical protein
MDEKRLLIECHIREGVSPEQACTHIAEIADTAVEHVMEDPETSKSYVWVSHPDDRRNYVHLLRSSGIFTYVEYVDDEEGGPYKPCCVQ